MNPSRCFSRNTCTVNHSNRSVDYLSTKRCVCILENICSWCSAWYGCYRTVVSMLVVACFWSVCAEPGWFVEGLPRLCWRRWSLKQQWPAQWWSVSSIIQSNSWGRIKRLEFFLWIESSLKKATWNSMRLNCGRIRSTMQWLCSMSVDVVRLECVGQCA